MRSVSGFTTSMSMLNLDLPQCESGTDPRMTRAAVFLFGGPRSVQHIHLASRRRSASSQLTAIIARCSPLSRGQLLPRVTNQGTTPLPRASKTSALILAPVSADRLEPPPELGEIEVAIFRRTVAAVTPGHFAPEDLPLLSAFARAAALERRAFDQVNAGVGEQPSPWLGVHASAVKSLAALSVRLRVGPRSRAPSNNRRRSAKAGAPSYYELMDDGPRRKCQC